MQASLSSQKNTEASIRHLETQVGQLAKQVADLSPTQSTANTEVNPKESCKVIRTKGMPQKAKDPGSFTISCFVGNLFVEDALLNHGYGVNLISLSMLQQTGLANLVSLNLS